jgi:M6 family metalloprotease-like protein
MYNANFNSLGYESASIGYQRQQTLFINAIKFVESQIINSGINFDSNNDGFIDNIVFLMQGNVDCWGSIMWPATGQISYQSTFIGNKEVYFFNRQFSRKFDPSVFCHEFFHSIGAPDLYHYRQTFENEPTGEWDIMGINKTQHMTTFMKWKYGKWFSSIPEITKPGTYTLKPVSQSPYSCYKIKSPYSSTEYFMVEYRKKEGLFESTLSQNYDKGLIIYRINTLVEWGNLGGPPDEVYVYRPGGNQIFNGDLTNASFSSSSKRVDFNDDTNPSCFLSNGEPGWIDISNITSSGNEISFTLNAINFLPKPLNFQAIGQNEQILLSWNSPIKKGNQLQGYNLFINGSNTPINTALITDTLYINPISGNQIINKFKLTAKYQGGESDSVSCTSYYSTDPSVMDSLALVTIYNQCNGTNWIHNENWLKGPLSTWHGVIYIGKRVQALQLNGDTSNYSGLLNSLPKEIGYLTELNSLDLCYNLLTGSLPKEFFTLNKLNFLRIFFSQLSGKIPKEIGKLKALTTLFLEYCNFSGNIPEEITNLPNLEYLSLSGNSLSGELPKSMWQLSNLNTLVLNENNFTGTIPKEISNLSKLGNLSLFSNNFSGNLPTELGLLTGLFSLNLSYNKFSGPLPNELFNLTKLTHLLLKGNEFSGTIPVTVGNLVNLEWLELNDNNLSGALPEEIGRLTKMKDLFRLNNNSFTGVIPKGIANFLNVKAIVLGNNKFESIPDLSHFTKLEAIQLDGNRFTFEDLEPNMKIIFPKGSYGITYRSQAKIGSNDTVFCPISKPYALSVYCGGKNNSY